MTSSKAWTEPASKLGSVPTNDPKIKDAPPLYPYVNGTYTESGHLFLMNDTPDSECIRLQHRNESFVEFHPNGDIVIKSPLGNNYVIVSNGNNNVFVGGDYNIEATGDFSLNVKGDYNLNVNGDYVTKVSGAIINLHDEENGGGINNTAKGDFSLTSKEGNIVLNCSNYPDTKQVIVNGNLLVNGTIKAQGSITTQCNITANESVFAMVSLKTLGSLHVGPSAALTPNVPVPGMGFFDVGGYANAFFNTPGIGIFGGMTFSLDSFYSLSGITFATHSHIDTDGDIDSPPF